jgi:MFS family permease
MSLSGPSPANRSLPQQPTLRRLYLGQALRAFGDGFAVILLPVYLSAIGLGTAEIGIIASASLLGTAVLTLAVGFLAPRYDLRTLFIVGACLVVVTGAGLPSAGSFVPVLIVAFVGSINATSGNLGMLVPLEHALLTKASSDRRRTRAFADYSLIGALMGAGGSLAAAFPQWLTSHGVAELTALKLMFYGYAGLGLIAVLLYRGLPRTRDGSAPPPAPLGPSRRIVYRLAALFSVDAFAGGFIAQSLLALWLFQKFELSLSAASLFFFWSTLLSAASYPVAAWLAARFGLINTMVFTHLPSSLCLIAAAFSDNLTVVLALLLIRSALAQMDVPTRSSYVMAVVTPGERTAAASVTAVPRSFASSISPAIAGVLFAGPFSGLPLVLCGSLKIAYDLALLAMFRATKAPEER